MNRIRSLILCAFLAPGMAAAQTGGPTLVQRVDRLERIMENQLKLYLQLESLQKELDALRGEQEVLRHRLDRLDKSQRDLYLDIDNRLRQLEAAMEQLLAPPSETPPPLVGSDVPPPAQPENGGDAGLNPPPSLPLSAGDQGDAKAYEQAFALLKDGHYDEAIAAFQAYLGRFPDGRYAANAQYWLGEAYYVKRDFTRAIQEFSQVLARFPESSKVPDAMLKLGFSHYELKEWAQARKILQQLIDQYPDTTAARLAKRRLQQMKLEGHG